MSLAARKDPTAAFLLSICVPGAGQAFAGSVVYAAIAFGLTGSLYWFADWEGPAFYVAVALHVLGAFHAASLATAWNAGNAPEPLPPPPPASMTAPRKGDPAALAGATPPPTLPALQAPARTALTPPSSLTPPPAPLDADLFMAEVRRLWTEHRAGALDQAQFAAAKDAAILRIRVADTEEGEALLEAASALVSAGVITSDERGRLQRRAAAK